MCGLPEPFHSAGTPIAFIHAKPPSPRYASSPGMGLSGGSGGASTISARRSLRSGNHSRSLDNTSLSGVWGSYGAHSRSYTLVDTSIPSSWSYTLTRSPSSAVTHDAPPSTGSILCASAEYVVRGSLYASNRSPAPYRSVGKDVMVLSPVSYTHLTLP